MTSPRVIAAAALLLVAPPALAQGTQAQRAACGRDAFNLCASYIPDAGAIAACLRRERPNLSGACRATLDAADGSRAAMTGPPRRAGRDVARPPAMRYRVVRTRDGRRVVRAVAIRQRPAAGGLAGLMSGFGTGRAGSREARYWMRQLAPYAPMAMGLIGGSGLDLGALRDVRVGELLEMME